MIGYNRFVDANGDSCAWFGYALQIVRSLACYFFQGTTAETEGDNTRSLSYHNMYASIRRSVEISDSHGAGVPFIHFRGFVDHILVLPFVVGFQCLSFIISNITVVGDTCLRVCVFMKPT